MDRGGTGRTVTVVGHLLGTQRLDLGLGVLVLLLRVERVLLLDIEVLLGLFELGRHLVVLGLGLAQRLGGLVLGRRRLFVTLSQL